MTLHIRNPIKRHGDNPSAQFVMIPNELARDPELSNHAYRIAIEMRSHAQDFEVSAAAIAKAHGWGRARVKQALDELAASGWLAVRRCVNAAGNRVFDEYHLNVARRFTPEELIEWSRPVIMQATDGSIEAIPMDSDEARGCVEPEHPPASSDYTKEDQQQDQQHDQLEDNPDNQPPECWICDDTGVYAGGPCENCCRPVLTTDGRTDEDGSASNEATCYGCNTYGRNGCLTHTSSAVGRLQLSDAGNRDFIRNRN